MSLTLVYQQTNIERSTKERLTRYAKRNGLLIQYIWKEATTAFLQRRKECIRRGCLPRYTARSRNNLVAWSVRLPEFLVDEVTTAAGEDDTSVRLLYYTALIEFLENQKP